MGPGRVDWHSPSEIPSLGFKAPPAHNFIIGIVGGEEDVVRVEVEMDDVCLL